MFLNFNIVFFLFTFTAEKRQLTTAGITNLTNAATQIPPIKIHANYDDLDSVRRYFSIVLASILGLGVLGFVLMMGMLKNNAYTIETQLDQFLLQTKLF